MVCDFPVPGGPSITKLVPSATSRTAECWELSTGRAKAGTVFVFFSSSTSRRASRSWTVSPPSTQEPIRAMLSSEKRSGSSSDGEMPVDLKMPIAILLRRFHSGLPFLVA